MKKKAQKKTVKVKKTSPKDTLFSRKDYLEVIAENIDNKFQIMSEGFSILSNQIKEVGERLNNKIDSFQSETNSKFETVFDYLSKNEVSQDRLTKIEK